MLKKGQEIFVIEGMSLQPAKYVKASMTYIYYTPSSNGVTGHEITCANVRDVFIHRIDGLTSLRTKLRIALAVVDDELQS